MAMSRVILHLDMDAFFASVEQLDDPSLRGKPVLVGHDGPRGVVAAASYEARRFGCHSAQPIAVAKRMCPQAIIMPVRGDRYRELSQRMFAILESFSPVVEPLSVDEAFLDATGCERLFGPPMQMAQQLKDRIRRELSLTASVGIAPNKFLAKLASDLRKPDGLVMMGPAEIDTLLPPLPVTRIWGIGPATAAKLASIGIRTIGDLRNAQTARLARVLGGDAEHYVRLAYGKDDRPVVPDRAAKSIGHEQTFAVDVEDVQEVRRILHEQVQAVAYRLRKHGLRARCVGLKIRFGDFQTIHRSATLEHFTDGTAELWAAARALFAQWAETSFRPVRLIGMTAEQLSESAGQFDLFGEADQQKQQRIDQAVDEIVDRFGKKSIRRGS